MKIKKNVRLSDSYYNKSEIQELYSKGLINLCDYLDIKDIRIERAEAYLNEELIDHCYLGQKYSFGDTYFYAKHNNDIVVCNIYCRVEGVFDSSIIYIYQLNILDINSKLKYLL